MGAKHWVNNNYQSLLSEDRWKKKVIKSECEAKSINPNDDADHSTPSTSLAITRSERQIPNRLVDSSLPS